MKQMPPATPAPALSRGLQLIGLLSTEGQASLEQLAKLGGWPKSSTLRYLQALQAEGVVRQDGRTKTWHLLKTLRPIPQEGEDPLAPVRRQLAFIAESCGHCTELYRISQGTVELVDRADPEDCEVRVMARIGFVRSHQELDATMQVFLSMQTGSKSPGRQWVWKGGRKTVLSAGERNALIQETGRRGYGMDVDFNENGIRRFTVPVIHAGNLLGILAVAQRQTPRAESEATILLKALSAIQETT